jgi:hypothetical protein
MTKYTFSISHKNQKRLFNIAHCSFGKDRSLYVMPSLGNKLGLHLSFHATGETHIASNKLQKPVLIDRQSLISDITYRKQHLMDNNADFGMKKGPAIIAILQTNRLLKNLQPLLGRRINMDAENIMESLVMAHTYDIPYSLNFLKEKQYATDRDIAMIQDINTGHITWFKFPAATNFDQIKSVTINPTDLNSLYQLPGLKPLFDPMKEAIKNIDKMYLLNQNYNDEINLSNLSPRLILNIKNPK